MVAFWVLPTIGRAVSRGVLGTKDLDAPNGAGLLSARKGVRPVAVGPVRLSAIDTVYDDWKECVPAYISGVVWKY